MISKGNKSENNMYTEINGRSIWHAHEHNFWQLRFVLIYIKKFGEMFSRKIPESISTIYQLKLFGNRTLYSIYVTLWRTHISLIFHIVRGTEYKTPLRLIIVLQNSKKKKIF